jgi:hypothetical protein
MEKDNCIKIAIKKRKRKLTTEEDDIIDEEPIKQKKIKVFPLLCIPHTIRDNKAKTPLYLYQTLSALFTFDFDPCPSNPTFDGLFTKWGQCNFVNPPFNHTLSWVIKALLEQLKGNTSVLLIPLKPSVHYFKYIISPKLDSGSASLFLLSDKIKFEGYKAPLPQDCCIVVFPGSYSPVIAQETRNLLNEFPAQKKNPRKKFKAIMNEDRAKFDLLLLSLEGYLKEREDLLNSIK